MTDTMTIEEYHEYNRTGRMPERFAKPTRSGVLAKVAEQDPELARAAAAALNGNAADTETNAKAELEEYLVYGGFGRVEREYRFHPERKWRADYALIDQNPLVLVEYDGLMHHGDNVGHGSIRGILRDAEKANHAVALGFRYFRGNAKSIQSGDFLALLGSVLMTIEVAK